ncbi:MAG: hypothetical protein ACFFDP_13160 [Promethearchaeota archaeon]
MGSTSKIMNNDYKLNLLLAMNALVDKGKIKRKILRKYAERYLDQQVEPGDAILAALEQMRDEGKIKRDKILREVDKLKLDPRYRAAVERFFS